MKISRGRFSYLHPERTKPVTGRKLGTHYEETYLLKLFEENAKAEKEHIRNPENPDTSGNPNLNIIDIQPFSILFIKSYLHLVADLQKCVKARESAAYAQFQKSRNKGQFRKEHSSETTLYETARNFLKDHSVDGKVPSLKTLKIEKELLLQQQTRKTGIVIIKTIKRS